MLIVAHPLALFDCDDIIHSHVDPAWWASQTVFPDSALHASVRNPAGIVNSSCFSLNALASEHIQKFLPPDQDNDLIRQELALYKLSDLKFFEGIVRFYVKAFADFLPVQVFAVMRWEELILNPSSDHSGRRRSRRYANRDELRGANMGKARPRQPDRPSSAQLSCRQGHCRRLA